MALTVLTFDKITHSPILNGLKTVAGMVSHAIPVVGKFLSRDTEDDGLRLKNSLF